LIPQVNGPSTDFRAGVPLAGIAKSLAFVLLSSGCGAARGTYFLVDAEQRLQAAREGGAPQAVYQWTMAEEHMRKAYEEWGYSDYEAAESMASLAVDWADKADEMVKSAPTPIQTAPEGVPDKVNDAAVPMALQPPPKP
jgi:hypothetical protein